MPTHHYICPIDQPTGAFRLIDWLENNFLSPDYITFRCLVAFAKIKPFYKIHDSIQKWNARGNQSDVVIGIDHKGTSYQALQYALANFDSVNILHANYSTFHPKLYIFSGSHKAAAYYGSSNFTSGGLETNFEGGIIIDFDLPADQSEFDDILKCFQSVCSPSVSCLSPLTTTFLDNLKNNGFLLDETIAHGVVRTSTVASSVVSASTPTTTSPLFNDFTIKPARVIPKSVMTTAAASAGIIMPSTKSSGTRRRSPATGTPRSVPTVASVVVPVLPDGFVIQVIPHHNGEILLSKNAIYQNKAFFGFPFTGTTIPKKPSNPTYPQRTPDPIVNIRVYDKTGKLVNAEQNYSLNTVYYEKKSEVRITITPEILRALNVSAITTNYPILVMRLSSTPGCDYDLDFFEYGSPAYKGYLSICDQTLPSGGKPIARKMGWI